MATTTAEPIMATRAPPRSCCSPTALESFRLAPPVVDKPGGGCSDRAVGAIDAGDLRGAHVNTSVTVGNDAVSGCSRAACKAACIERALGQRFLFSNASARSTTLAIAWGTSGATEDRGRAGRLAA
jgi:hypothetical protein